jgi:O-antigen/teichoic acid export membrane protein
MSKNTLVINSAIGILQFILTAILTLLSVPVFINKLGLELYGIFALVSVIGNLNLLSNFGLNSALLVYVAKQGKCRESDHDILATQIIMLAIMTLFITATVILKENIVLNLFSIPTKYSSDSGKLLIYLVFANALLLLGQTYTAVIDAQQKIHLTNICQFIYSLVYWGGMIAVVSLGGSLVTIGIIAFSA